MDGSELARLAREDGQCVEEFQDGALIDQIADDLAAGRIVGWMEGALEFGPRALGHRSILAAPHTVEMRDRLNREIKYREPFRPFAPVVPIEVAASLFRYSAGRHAFGAFHVGRISCAAANGSRGCRPSHTSTEQLGCRRWSLRWHHACMHCSEAYGRRTGMPVLLNTSFNLAGEPIVNRAVEGYSTFLRCGIDVLVAGQTRVMKRASSCRNTSSK